MKDRKFRPEGSLQFYDYERIECHLAQMAAKGWRLERISGLGWHYRRAPAKKLTYAVEYFEEGSDFNAGLPSSQREFVEYCEAAGWQLVTTWAQMMIFVSEEENPTPIETEPTTRLETIARSMKRNFLPGSFVLIALGLIQICMLLSGLRNDPIGFWSGLGLYAVGCWLLITALYACRVGNYLVWLHRSRRAVEAGGDCLPMHTGWIAAADCLVIGWEVVLLTAMYVSMGMRWVGYFAVLIAGFFLNLLLTGWLRDFLRGRGADAWVNRLVTVGFCALFSIALTGGTVWYGLGHYEPAGENAIYEVKFPKAYTVELQRDAIPLTVEPLGVTGMEAETRSAIGSETVFLKDRRYVQRCYRDGRQMDEGFSYQVLDVRWDALYETCLRQRLDDVNEDEVFDCRWEPVDPARWQAQRVYRLYWEDEERFGDRYLVCWTDRIVQITFGWTPTDAQLDRALQTLAPG